MAFIAGCGAWIGFYKCRLVPVCGYLLRDLRTGEPLLKQDRKTGKMVPWTILNGGSCGTPSACDAMVFYRKGSTAWRRRGTPELVGGAERSRS